MVLYAAADAPLRLIDAGGPAAQLPPLSVRPVEGGEIVVLARFIKPHVYFLGAHGGCSCGFAYDEPGNAAAAGRASVRALRAWLAEQVASVGPVELYSCWVGDEGAPATAQERITAAYFRDDADWFELPERWLATVVPASPEVATVLPDAG